MSGFGDEGAGWRGVECLEGPEGCGGEVVEYLSLSGSGARFARCEAHYARYVERVQPRMEEIRERYPELPPADFDPSFAGERWEDDY